MFYANVGKVIGWIFLMLSIHELAHILCAIMFNYKIEKLCIYPFGLSADISHIGHGDLFQEIMIISAGPLMHVCFPYLFQFAYEMDYISLSFMQYLYQINASILLFNLLPIYPLDGGRLLQAFFHCFLRYKKAEQAMMIVSMIILMFVIYFHLLNGISSIFVFIFLCIQLCLSWRMLPYSQLQFYHYRHKHPVNYPLCFNKKSDLFRGRYNLMRYRNTWIKEEDWLNYRFFFFKKKTRLP